MGVFYYFSVFFYFISLSEYCNVLCNKSFTLVVDTTVSMKDELYVIKSHIGQVMAKVSRLPDVADYGLVTFNDPDLNTRIISPSASSFMDSISIMRTQLGQDCPENSMAGIERGLEISRPESFVFVFTDAYAKDQLKINSIANLCREKNSKVVIFLSGNCVEDGTIDVYYDTANFCDGNVFRFNTTSTLRQAFRYMFYIVGQNWNEDSVKVSFSNLTLFTFTVDKFTTDLLIFVMGDNPNVKIMNGNGQYLQGVALINTIQSLAIYLNKVDAGRYQINATCTGGGNLKLSFSKKFPFLYGFSTRLPRSMKETSLKPLPDDTSYIVLKVPDDLNIELNTITLTIMIGEIEKNVMELDKINNDPKLYYARAYFRRHKSFKITVTGRDAYDYAEFSVSTQTLGPQDMDFATTIHTVPKAEIFPPDETIVDYGSSIIIACKITALHPSGNIWWEDSSGKVYASEHFLLEMPSVFVSYVSLDNVTANVTIFCRARNSDDELSDDVELFVRRLNFYNILEIPRDTAIEYGESGKLSCSVDAYPEAHVRWYHNNTVIDRSDDSDNYEINQNGLVIKNMNTETTGLYMCEWTNDFNEKTLSAVVTITGLEVPKVEIEQTEIVLRPDDDPVTVDCRITKGKPPPNLQWTFKFQNADEYKEIPTGISIINDTTLSFSEANSDYSGIYRCTAKNIQGDDYKEVTVRASYAPVIKDLGIKNIVIKEGDQVELRCEVDADPPATVRWELRQDGVLVELDHRHLTDDCNTHRFYALWKDSGDYRCVAENTMGETDETIAVDVLVAPYIQSPVSKVVNVRVGESVVLACNILYGNPMPITKWEFVAKESSTSTHIVSRENANRSLHLDSVTIRNEGHYSCIANNQIGTDSIKVYLKVT